MRKDSLIIGALTFLVVFNVIIAIQQEIRMDELSDKIDENREWTHNRLEMFYNDQRTFYNLTHDRIGNLEGRVTELHR